MKKSGTKGYGASETRTQVVHTEKKRVTQTHGNKNSRGREGGAKECKKKTTKDQPRKGGVVVTDAGGLQEGRGGAINV